MIIGIILARGGNMQNEQWLLWSLEMYSYTETNMAKKRDGNQ